MQGERRSRSTSTRRSSTTRSGWSTATRAPGTVGLGELDRYVTYGASPRASIALVLGGRALAFLRGRDYVLPHDVAELALDVLRHRLVLSYEALADDVDPDTIITRGAAAPCRCPRSRCRDR